MAGSSRGIQSGLNSTSACSPTCNKVNCSQMGSGHRSPEAGAGHGGVVVVVRDVRLGWGEKWVRLQARAASRPGLCAIAPGRRAGKKVLDKNVVGVHCTPKV